MERDPTETPCQEAHPTSEDTSRYQLLLVEDDSDLRRALTEYLQRQGYAVIACADGQSALDRLFTEPLDLVVLDVMLPGRDGFDILRTLRRAEMNVPVVMLTVKDSQEDILRGFELGADEYVPKPFSAELLEARIRAILSRTKGASESPMDIHWIGDLQVNFSSHEAHYDGRRIKFTALEYDLLRYLISNKGKVITRVKLLADVWHLPSNVDTRTVDRHIASLRKKVEPKREDPQYIRTVYGHGYRFEAQPVD